MIYLLCTAVATAQTVRRIISEVHTAQVDGIITFAQQGNPSTFTHDGPVTVTIQMRHAAGVTSYFISELPVDEAEASCVAAGGVYNPLGCNVAADPRCAVGALGRRHGGLPPLEQTYRDDTANFTLFGRSSIMGRSIVFTDAQDRPIACSIINFDAPTVVLRSEFRQSNLTGYFVFRQNLNDPKAETGILISLTPIGFNMEGNPWHVHKFPVTTDCMSTSTHWDPYNVKPSEGTQYNALCKPYDPTKCEMGDLAGKHGNLTITDRSPNHRFYFVDEQLALTTNLTILARSVVVHGPSPDETTERIACFNITAAEDTVTSTPCKSWFNLTVAQAFGIGFLAFVLVTVVFGGSMYWLRKGMNKQKLYTTIINDDEPLIRV